MRKKAFLYSVILAATVAIGLVDIYLSFMYRFSIFFILLIFISSLYLHRYFSYCIAAISLISMFLSYYLHDETIHAHLIWNTLVMAALYVFILIIVERFTHSLRIKRDNAILEERLRAQEKVLKEKEHLIREIHHRMKNMLTTLTSLISLSSKSNEEDTLLAVTNRLNTYTVLYSKLAYTPHREYTVQLKGYLQEIISLILRTSNDAGKSIEYRIQGDDCEIRSPEASLIGLIVNELTTNSLQHAFRESASGLIEISVSQTGPDSLEMRYHDSGPGFDPEVLEQGEGHLGMQLIRTLTAQLNGSYRYQRNSGSEYSFTFGIASNAHPGD
ncbi:MAG: sensor histidine kinase [Spirochaetes bacterium]|nr:sensor histidine kinase [Spirochaetota bacterium]